MSESGFEPGVVNPAGPRPGLPAGLPLGMLVALDPETVIRPDGSLFGGSPARLFRLNAHAQKAFEQLRAGTVRTPAGAALGRRFSDAGLIHPQAQGLPEGNHGREERCGVVTLVIPVRDRADELDRCLTSMRALDSTTLAEILIVDDESDNPAAVQAVSAKHGATLIRRSVNGGPGAARNTALTTVKTPLVAFCDSDCLPEPGWIDALLGHFDDPLVAAVAPRIVAAEPQSREAHEPRSLAARFSRARPVLDLGPQPARVAPMTRVSYVPTAALLLRRSALDDVGGPAGFDPDLRYGEDVDLIWRLIDAGWRVRYEPEVQVPHMEPIGWMSLLRRRFAYGTSAAALEDRHPGQVAPLILVASPALTVAALLARRPLLAAVTFGLGYLDVLITLRRSGTSIDGVLRPLTRGVRETFFGSGRWTAQFAAPLALALAALPLGSRRTRLGRRLALLTLLAAGPVREWAGKRPPIDVVSWTLAVLVDDASYGAGVWAGSLRQGHLRAVLPRLRWRSISRPASRQ
jgi:mycofactocin system glycosyltransferase